MRIRWFTTQLSNPLVAVTVDCIRNYRSVEPEGQTGEYFQKIAEHSFMLESDAMVGHHHKSNEN